MGTMKEWLDSRSRYGIGPPPNHGQAHPAVSCYFVVGATSFYVYSCCFLLTRILNRAGWLRIIVKSVGWFWVLCKSGIDSNVRRNKVLSDTLPRKTSGAVTVRASDSTLSVQISIPSASIIKEV